MCLKTDTKTTHVKNIVFPVPERPESGIWWPRLRKGLKKDYRFVPKTVVLGTFVDPKYVILCEAPAEAKK